MNVLVYAYLNNNFGDDLFVDILTDRYPNTHFDILNPGNCQMNFLKKQNVKIIDVSYFDRIVNTIGRFVFSRNIAYEKLGKNYDLFILIGGSMFIENVGWEKRLSQIESLICHADRSCIIGINFGPYSTQAFYDKHKKLLSEFNSVCFRDRKSFELFSDLQCVDYSSDIAFNLDCSCYTVSPKINVVSVCNYLKTEHIDGMENYIFSIEKLCLDLINRNEKVLLLGLCSTEGDKKIIDQIKNKLGDKVDAYCYDGDIKKVISLFADAKIVYATRFHSMILGLLFNKIIVPVVYDIKMSNVLEDIEYKGVTFCAQDNVVSEYIKGENNRIHSISDYIDSNSQFRYLDKVLAGEEEREQ